MRVISFSLYGTGPMYLNGAVENARLAHEVYPGWSTRFYVDDRVPSVTLHALMQYGAKVELMPRAVGGAAMCWRFAPSAESSVEYFISRDADSRLGPREKAAVEEWIQSGKKFSVLRDHPHHVGNRPVNGGLWGCKGGALPDMAKWISQWGQRPGWRERLSDMDLLRDKAWPLMKSDVCQHVSVSNPWGVDPFPEHEPWCDPNGRHYFVGQQFDENGVGIWP